MSVDCRAAKDGVTCGKIGEHTTHLGVDEDGRLVAWSDPHEVGAVPVLSVDGRTVVSWRAVCASCEATGPDRNHRALAAHDAERHRPEGAAFPDGTRW